MAIIELSNERSGIPIVDLQAPDAPENLLEAACDHGFVFIRHKDFRLTPQDVDNMFDLSRHFFIGPVEDKASCTINSKVSGKNHGWLSPRTETLDPVHSRRGDYKEAFNVGEYINGKPQQPFPKLLSSHEKEIGDFIDKCHSLCNQILDCLAISLDIPEHAGGSKWFSTRHEGRSASVLRLLYYPRLPNAFDTGPEDDIRAGAHSDYGSVTLLFRLPSQPGLEILTPSGSWVPVPVDPEPSHESSILPILVNLGDLMPYWTGGLLKSTVHRVIFPRPGEGPRGGEDRYSIAYFSHPRDDAQLVDIPSPVVQTHRSKVNGDFAAHDGKVVTARDHLNSRLAATYGVR